MFKFIKDPEYHQKHFFLNENRKLVKELDTSININTLVKQLGCDVLSYSDFYDALSLLLHPNPSALKFYAQAEGTPTEDGNGIFRPIIKHYFDQTVAETKSASDWFSSHTWFFFGCVEHFLVLFDALKAEFYVNDSERKQHANFVTAELLKQHRKEVQRVTNEAIRAGTDPGEAISKLLNQLTQAK